MKKRTNFKYLWMLIASSAMLLVIYLPLPDTLRMAGGAELTSTGRAALGTLLFCFVLWVTEPIPFHITGLLGLVLLTFLRITTFKQAVSVGFGSETVMFFLGVLVLSAFISRSGLGKRIAMFILSKTGNDTHKILLGFLLGGAMIAMWVTCMAAAAIITPLAAAILKEEGLEPQRSNFGRALLIACAWGPIIGGMGTPAGSGPNQLAIGFIRDMLGIEVTFLDWMAYGVPSMFSLVIPAWLILRWFFKPEIRYLSKSKEQLQKDFAECPPMSRDEKATLLVFAATVLLWVTAPWLSAWLGFAIPTALPAILAICLLFLPGVTQIPWADISRDISWSGIMLIGAGISLGLSLYDAGAAAWLASLLLGGIAQMQPVWMILMLILITALIKMGLSSNTVTATVITPIIIMMVKGFSLPAMSVLIPSSLTLSLAFILVTSTPTSVIPYTTGYFKISDMAKAGTAMTLVSSVILTAIIYGVGMLKGIY